MFDSQSVRQTDRIVIFGIGAFADQIFRYLMMEGIHVTAFTVEKDFCELSSFHDLPVVPFEELDKTYAKDSFSILICVGYNKMNQIRKRIFETVKEKGYRISSFIHPTATVLATDFGEGNIVLENANIGIGCIIGNGNIFYNNSVICHDAIIQDFNYFSPSVTVLGGAIVQNCCFLGGNSTIKNKAIVRDYSLVGANAFVRQDTKEKSVIVPAMSASLNRDSFSIIERIM